MNQKIIEIGSGKIYQGHVVDILPTLPANSVDCVVTSPPYWGLRDYKIEPQVWDVNHGPDGSCKHEWGSELTSAQRLRNGAEGGLHEGRATDKLIEDTDIKQGSFCLRCGAWRGSLGLEPTPELFVSHIVQVFREVRRVLKPTGVCFVNLGDSYTSGNRTHRRDADSKNIPALQNFERIETPPGLKPKDLCGIPWRVAFALQADGWWLRSDIIWSKPNPMPESVTDRPTKSHEYIFLLTKSAKYFWNQEAVREPHSPDGRNDTAFKGSDKYENGFGPGASMSPKRGHERWPGSGRNIRSVWTFATEPTPEAHFATFPQELVKRCILAGTSEKGCCPKCGKPWEPVYDRLGGPPRGDHRKNNELPNTKTAHKTGTLAWSQLSSVYEKYGYAEYKVTGWQPTCSCGEEDPLPSSVVPAVVLDPFFGSGTTGIVAENLYRKWIGIELNPEYIAIAEKRLRTKANIDQGNWLKE
jgi:DNA modification methylase